MNLKDWSKAHAGKMEFKPERVELGQLLRGTETLFAGALLQKSIRISINVPGEIVVLADKNMIGTIVRNLVSNAIKFTHSGGLIVLAVSTDQLLHVISVSDNGVGIPKVSINMLFRIDQGYSTLGTEREKGTGWGLILCKELIDKHNGRIWVESESGKGSTFYVSLPRVSV